MQGKCFEEPGIVSGSFARLHRGLSIICYHYGMKENMRIALYCVGNRLMMDDGVGPAVYDELQAYHIPECVDLFDVGCLTLSRINDVRDYDLIVSVDAVEGTEQPAGTIFKFSPEDLAQRTFGTQSLHDLKLSDLFVSASLLGYECEGVCYGMQVENASPAWATVGLSASVHEKLPDLVDCVLAELVKRGLTVTLKATGEKVTRGFHHDMTDTDPR